MALNKAKLIAALISAETDGVDLTSEARQGVILKCNAYADAIDEYIKSATVLVNVYPGIPVATTGTPAAQAGATTAPGVGESSEIF